MTEAFTSRSSPKKVRLCGHIIEYSLSNNKTKSNMSFIILNTNVYYSNIVSYLFLLENIKLKSISKYHNKFYDEPQSRQFLKQLMSYDYGIKFLKLDHHLNINVKKMYTNYNYLCQIMSYAYKDEDAWNKPPYFDGIEIKLPNAQLST